MIRPVDLGNFSAGPHDHRDQRRFGGMHPALAIKQGFDDRRFAGRGIIPLAVDARRQRFPEEQAYCYAPLAGADDCNRWNEAARESILKDYNLLDMYI